MTECLYRNWTPEFSRVIRNWANKKFAFPWVRRECYSLFHIQTKKQSQFKYKALSISQAFSNCWVLHRVHSPRYLHARGSERSWESLALLSPSRRITGYLHTSKVPRNQVTKYISLSLTHCFSCGFKGALCCCLFFQRTSTDLS